MQIKGKYSWAKHLDFMIVDILALLLAFFLAYWFKFGTLRMGADWTGLIAIMVLMNIVITIFVNPYSGIFRRRYYQELGRAAMLVGINALAAALLFYVLKIGAVYSREVVFYTYLLYFVLAVILKYFWKKLLISGKVRLMTTKKMAMFVIAEENNADKVLHNAGAGDLQIYEIRGIHFVPPVSAAEADGGQTPQQRTGTFIPQGAEQGIPVVGEDFVQFILDENIDEVLVAVQPGALDSKTYETLIANGVGVDMVVEAAVGFQTEEQFITNIGVYKALSVGTFSFTPTQSIYLGVKRLFDIVCGLIGLVFLVPITLVVKLVYLASGDREKIFYRQNRVGKNGKIIRIWKFRSMVPNADEILQELLKEEKWRLEWEENQKFENDPRITKAGRVLRKTSVDELPQLLNVLLGDMSLVGPRPLVEGELEKHGGLKIYQKVKPGITGWWGCNGRSNIDYRERLELEYYYVKNCSLYLDILCIIRTVFAVLKKDGAQ